VPKVAPLQHLQHLDLGHDFVVQVVASKVAVHWDEPPHVPQHAVHEVHAGREVEGLDGLSVEESLQHHHGPDIPANLWQSLVL